MLLVYWGHHTPVEAATSERRLVYEQASEAQIPAANGYVGILPGHAALLAELGFGVLTYAAGQRRTLTVSGGWLEVADDHVRVLADGIEREAWWAGCRLRRPLAGPR